MAFLTKAANRGSIATGYEIDNSLKFEEDNSEVIATTNQAAGDRKTWTFSAWVKRTELTYDYATIFGAEFTIIKFLGDDRLELALYNGTYYSLITTQKFRDTSAWYHIVAVCDTTQATASERSRLYVNGERVTVFDTSNSPPLNSEFAIGQAGSAGSGAWLRLGQFFAGSDYFNGYMAEVHYLNGTAAQASDFGEYDSDSGIWIPKEYTGGGYGTQGFYYKFDNASNLGEDSSGEGHDANTISNITSADQATDTPTNNFCTLNPLSYNVPYIATQGNTKMSKNDTTYGLASGTHYVGAGKWYWEIKATDIGVYYNCAFGIVDAAKPTLGPSETGYEDPSLSADDPEILAMSGSPNSWYMNGTGTIANNGSTNSVDYTFYDGDILAFALDMDNGGYWMGNSRYQGVANGSFWIAPGGTATSGSVAITDPTNGNYALVGDGGGTNNGTPNFNGGSINGGSLLTAGFTLVTPLLGAYSANTSVTLEVNFGGFTSYGETGGYSDENGYGNFAYAVPSGFYCLCSKNIAEFGGTA